jgi:hypothetical protein
MPEKFAFDGSSWLARLAIHTIVRNADDDDAPQYSRAGVIKG